VIVCARSLNNLSSRWAPDVDRLNDDIKNNNNHNPDSDGPDFKSINRLLFGEARCNLNFKTRVKENRGG